MFRALELMAFDLLCLYSNIVPYYLEQSIRNTQPVAPVRSKEIFQFIQQGPSEILDHCDSVLFPDAKLQEKVMSYTCRQEGKKKQCLLGELEGSRTVHHQGGEW